MEEIDVVENLMFENNAIARHEKLMSNTLKKLLKLEKLRLLTNKKRFNLEIEILKLLERLTHELKSIGDIKREGSDFLAYPENNFKREIDYIDHAETLLFYKEEIMTVQNETNKLNDYIARLRIRQTRSQKLIAKSRYKLASNQFKYYKLYHNPTPPVRIHDVTNKIFYWKKRTVKYKENLIEIENEIMKAEKQLFEINNFISDILDIKSKKKSIQRIPAYH